MRDDDSAQSELRAAGFRRTQKLWLSQENYDLVMWLAQQDKVTVDRILDRARWQRRND
jgi:hypothetical protein